MTTDDQTEAIAFLAAPATHRGATAEVIDTHISKVFLAGDRAFKLKRAVRLPYADFSTPAIRLAACHKELALNGPHAPGLYLAVRRITRTAAGGLEFDGPGALVDAVVEMARFAPDALFDDMARAGRLTPALIADLAHVVARFHAAAPVVAEAGAANIAAVLDINRAGFATSRVFAPAEVAALDARCRAALGHHAAALDRRAAAGAIRRCHGDLHLRNVCRFRGRPTLFDCIEFNDRIATVDVLYDLAFLLMDLWFRDLHGLANLTANRYFDAAGGDDGFGLLPFFMAVRAAVRAHVTATQAQTGGAPAASLAATARRYFDLAGALLRPAPPVALAIGGFSGSGKTTLAEALAPDIGAPPGARIVESDRTRKALFGVASDTRLPPEAYRPEVSARVYDALSRRAAVLLGEGASVVVNAVFDREASRRALETALAPAGARFAGVWLDADAATLRDRVGRRRGGPSDADVAVLEAQLRHGTGDVGWHRIDAARPIADSVAAIRAWSDLTTGRS